MRPLLLVGLVCCLTACMPAEPTASQLPTQSLVVGGEQIVAEVASTASQQQTGLGGRTEIEEGTGMLFPFEQLVTPSFWMKDVPFSIDIVWIRDGRVLGIEHSVVPDDGARTYPAPGPVDSVLELPGGWSERHGLEPGDDVQSNL